MNQDYPELEIIFVDNNSTDKSVEKIRHFPIKIEKEIRMGSYIARNSGFRKSNGNFIAFIDADCIAEKNWVSKLIKCYNNEEVGAVGGKIKPFKSQTELEIYANDDSTIQKIEIYFDNELTETLSSEPYVYMIKKFDTIRHILRSHTIKVIAYDDSGKTAEAKIDVITILL